MKITHVYFLKIIIYFNLFLKFIFKNNDQIMLKNFKNKKKLFLNQ